MTTTIFNQELIQRYDKSGPRYTSYPTAVQFHEGFTESDYRQAAEQTLEVGMFNAKQNKSARPWQVLY